MKTSRINAGGWKLLAIALAATSAAVAFATAVDPLHLVQLLTGIDWGTTASGLLLANAVAATPAEHIAALKKKITDLQAKAAGIWETVRKEGRTRDEREREELDEIAASIKAVQDDIDALELHEKQVLGTRSHVIKPDAGIDDDDATKTKSSRGTAADLGNRPGSMTVKDNLPPGIGFTRFALCMAKAKGNVMLAHEIAKAQYADTPQVVNCLKAAISMGGTRELSAVNKAAVTPVAGTDSAVTQFSDLESQFVGLLRPRTVLGRMDRVNRVPFLSRLGRQLTGVTGAFVGEGAPKPVQKQTYDNVTLGYAKVAVIVVLSDEAVRFSSINAEMRARDDMIRGIATFLDRRFMDPSFLGVPNVSPASITSRARRVQSSGTTLAAIDADVRNAMADFAASDVDPSSAVWVMNGTVALRLALRRNAYDEPAFPGMASAIATGRGEWYGLPVLVSNAMTASGSPGELQIALVTQEEVSLADEGNISIDMSEQASVQMDDAPSAGAQSLVSLWQMNLLGVRAEQYINWGARRPNNLGIVLIENTNY